MTAIEQIELAQKMKLVNVTGSPLRLKLSPPLAPEEIDALQEQVGQPLPDELRKLLAFCSGIEGCVYDIDFAGGGMLFEYVDAFPNGLAIAADGCGNFWVLDITPETTATAPVFFACHDAPVILYQSANLSEFLAEVFRIYSPPGKSLAIAVNSDFPFHVWRRNPGVIDYATALRSSDISLRSFAAELSDEFQFVDLRNVEPGMGFSWGRYGPQTRVRRYGFERIFAYAKPIRKGLLQRLLGW